MLRPSLLAALFTAALACSATPVCAQSSSLFGTSGPTRGQSTLGNSSSMRGSSTRSTGGTGLTTGGTGAGATNGFQVETGNPIGSQDIQLSGQTGFVGRSDNTGRFVGNAQSASQTGSTNTNLRGGTRGATSRTGTSGANFRQLQNSARGRNTGGNFGTNFGMGQNGRSNVQAVLRPQQRIAFDFPARQSPVVVQSINTRIQQQIRLPALKGVTAVSTAPGTVVLQGTVPTEDARKLAAAMARLEPGVNAVQNNLEVDGSQGR